MTNSLLPVCHKYLATSNNGGWNRTTSIKSYSCTKHASGFTHRRESNPIYFTRPVLILLIQSSTAPCLAFELRDGLTQCYFELIARDSTWLHLFLKSLRYRLDLLWWPVLNLRHTVQPIRTTDDHRSRKGRFAAAFP